MLERLALRDGGSLRLLRGLGDGFFLDLRERER
jgi:hypothetical protein